MLDPLQEQQVLFTTEPSLWPLRVEYWVIHVGDVDVDTIVMGLRFQKGNVLKFHMLLGFTVTLYVFSHLCIVWEFRLEALCAKNFFGGAI